MMDTTGIPRLPVRMRGTQAKAMEVVHPGTLWRIASARMPTKWGMFQAIGFERDSVHGGQQVDTALAVVMGNLTEGTPLLRIHSQCFTGEMLGSLRCDCHGQLAIAMRAIAEDGRGLVIYEYQEGRGIGLMAKLEAYELQDTGLDTVEANHALGFKADCRDFSFAVAILREIGIKRVRLLSNNPRKVEALRHNGVEVAAWLPCEAVPNPHSLAYLQTKKEKLGHTLSLASGERAEGTGDLLLLRSGWTARRGLQPARRRSRPHGRHLTAARHPGPTMS